MIEDQSFSKKFREKKFTEDKQRNFRVGVLRKLSIETMTFVASVNCQECSRTYSAYLLSN